MVGEGLAELVAKAAPGLSGAAFESLKADAGAALAENLIVRTRPFPGVEGLLDGLGARGLPVAILSNKPHGLALRTVEAIFPGRDFALVRGESPDFPRKPHPAAALDIASRLGLEPAALAFVGDSATDMRTAVNAGMEAIGVAWGYRDREELLAAGARRVAADCAELLALLA
jgi:phosphoglycolate phosphatase